MPRKNPGLTDEQVAKLRTSAAGPRKPRVTLLDTQFGAEAAGQVLSVGDPATDGDDFITVRVKLGGVADTLTFGPGELAVPTRGRPKSTTTKSGTITPAARKAPPTPALPRVATRAQAPAPAPNPAAATSRPRRTATGKRRSPAPVTITVSSAGNSWKLTAMRSGRSLVKATPLAPGVVTALADLFADPALQQAVSEINDVSLTEAEERARQLRDELAEIESLLKSHQRPGIKRGR